MLTSLFSPRPSVAMPSLQDGVMLSIRGRKPLRARAAILTGPPPAILKMELLDEIWLPQSL